MMRANLCCHILNALLRNDPHHFSHTPLWSNGKMKVRARLPRQHNISGRDHVLHRIGNSGKPQTLCIFYPHSYSRFRGCSCPRNARTPEYDVWQPPSWLFCKALRPERIFRPRKCRYARGCHTCNIRKLPPPSLLP